MEMKNKTILIVDDELDICVTLSKILNSNGYKTITATNSSSCLNELKKNFVDLVLLDVWLEGSKKNGIELLKIIKNYNKNLPVILISGHGNIEMAVNAIKKGAFYFVEKPFKSEKLFLLIERALENAFLKKEYEVYKNAYDNQNEIIGHSKSINKIKKNINKLARTNARIFLFGEPGTGKKLIAKKIHESSSRSDKPFISINCSMLNNESFVEQFFGKDRIEDKSIGYIQKAEGGTILLNEICNMAFEVQAKLTDFLQKETYSLKGLNEKVYSNIRFISTTSKNPIEEIEEKRFRKELFYRLNVAQIKVPSISKRRDDIPILIDFFIQKIKKHNNLPEIKLTSDVYTILQTCLWPGNITQLKNFVDWLYIMYPKLINKGKNISVNLLPKDLFKKSNELYESKSNQLIMNLPIRKARKEFEKKYLVNQVNRFGGNISKTANFIGMERSALHRKIKNIGIKK